MLLEPENSFWEEYFTHLPKDLQGKNISMIVFVPRARYRKGMVIKCRHNNGPCGILIIKDHPIFCNVRKQWRYMYNKGSANKTGYIYESELIQI